MGQEIDMIHLEDFLNFFFHYQFTKFPRPEKTPTNIENYMETLLLKFQNHNQECINFGHSLLQILVVCSNQFRSMELIGVQIILPKQIYLWVKQFMDTHKEYFHDLLYITILSNCID